ncbi:MAG: hypothetical protein FJW23_08885 [Acidimicrobiia bacterium]|nr:hypothetical protein [Acidimicrobiia bacterium]
MRWEAALVAVVLAGTGLAVVWAIGQAHRRQEVLALLQTFGSARAAALQDPRLLLVWQPLATAARRLFPKAFATLDRGVSGTFPFSGADLEQAHAAWTAAWLAFEAAHDEEYRLKADVAEQDVRRAADAEAAQLARARVSRIQHEKMERYQARYAEYIRTARTLQALLDQPSASAREADNIK